jgi:hypothetical protein
LRAKSLRTAWLPGSIVGNQYQSGCTVELRQILDPLRPSMNVHMDIIRTEKQSPPEGDYHVTVSGKTYGICYRRGQWIPRVA